MRTLEEGGPAARRLLATWLGALAPARGWIRWWQPPVIGVVLLLGGIGSGRLHPAPAPVGQPAPGAGIRAALVLPAGDHVRVDDPVKIVLSAPADVSAVSLSIRPAAPIKVDPAPSQLTLIPTQPWRPDTAYTVELGYLPAAEHHGPGLPYWKATFRTQTAVAVAGFSIDGTQVSGDARTNTHPTILTVFTTPMNPAATSLSLGGKPLGADQFQWSGDGRSVVVRPRGLLPDVPVPLAVTAGSSSVGDPLTAAGSLTLHPVVVLPTNPTSGIGPGFATRPPAMIVVENSPPARPQAGLQAADIVYEYLSEYQVTRMTAIYFNRVPGLVGPVRSCRMINPYLGFAFGGHTMCSGGSVGTLHYMFRDGHMVPGTINDFDLGGHFYRAGFRYAPHNVYTDGGRAARLRDEWHLPSPGYQLDPDHPDAQAGEPANAPTVSLHSASYTYDPGSGTYLRFDHGAPLTDAANNGRQLSIKNVVILHVPFHDAGWVEDENGGAHSVWYDMLGAGPAEIYSDDRLQRVTWHMGAGGGQDYADNHQPVYFTDAGGEVLRLNSGLTWIHVLGDGQSS